jgi:ferric-dicitrate binding protein FerR (iron transport regulator)
MAELLRQVVAVLNRLIHLEHDAIDACRFAVGGTTDRGDRARFAAWTESHKRHLEELASLVRSLGGEPAPRVLRVSWPSFSQEMVHAVHRRIACAYADAASQPGIPVDVLAMLERTLAEERAFAPRD